HVIQGNRGETPWSRARPYRLHSGWRLAPLAFRMDVVIQPENINLRRMGFEPPQIRRAHPVLQKIRIERMVPGDSAEDQVGNKEAHIVLERRPCPRAGSQCLVMFAGFEVYRAQPSNRTGKPAKLADSASDVCQHGDEFRSTLPIWI